VRAIPKSSFIVITFEASTATAVLGATDAVVPVVVLPLVVAVPLLVVVEVSVGDVVVVAVVAVVAVPIVVLLPFPALRRLDAVSATPLEEEDAVAEFAVSVPSITPQAARGTIWIAAKSLYRIALRIVPGTC
jgi:hypothetical protein